MTETPGKPSECPYADFARHPVNGLMQCRRIDGECKDRRCCGFQACACDPDDPDTILANMLTLALTAHWFDEIAAGRKTVEYRSMTPYWFRRIWLRKPSHVRFMRGYTRKGSLVRRVAKVDAGPCPYPGWEGSYFRIHLAPLDEPESTS